MFDYDEVLRQCPFFKEFIDQHVQMEVAKAVAVKDEELNTQQTALDILVIESLRGE